MIYVPIPDRLLDIDAEWIPERAELDETFLESHRLVLAAISHYDYSCWGARRAGLPTSAWPKQSASASNPCAR